MPGNKVKGSQRSISGIRGYTVEDIGLETHRTTASDTVGENIHVAAQRFRYLREVWNNHDLWPHHVSEQTGNICI